MSAAGVTLDMDGPAAPPRSNGELVFAEPWEGRAFGMAMALADSGAFEWEEFRQALIARISAWHGAPPEGEGWSYYRCWQLGLEDVLAAKSLISRAGLAARGAELTARPAGYDHGHSHGADDDHDHDHG